MAQLGLECENPLFPGGVATIFHGKTREYCIETYRTLNDKHTLANMPEYSALVTAVTKLYLEVYPNRNEILSIERMKRSLNHPRTILELATYEGNPVGFGIFPRLLIDTPEKPNEPVPVVYSTRAFLKDHAGEGLGTQVLNEGIRLHQEEVAKGHRRIDYVALMTQNPVSVYTLEKLSYVDKIWPFSELYENESIPQSLMLGVHLKVHSRSSLRLDNRTGVSAGEVSEIGINENVIPDQNSPQRLKDIADKMFKYPPEGLGVNWPGGDVVYVVFSLKRPREIVSVPVGQAA